MEDETFTLGVAYYFVLAIFAASGVGLAILLLYGEVAPAYRFSVGLGALAGLGAAVGFLACWQRYTVTQEGLHVRDTHGARRHRWTDLGAPDSHVIRDVRNDSVDQYVHVIYSAAGRPLYKLWPWFPRRKHLLREVYRRVRESR